MRPDQVWAPIRGAPRISPHSGPDTLVMSGHLADIRREIGDDVILFGYLDPYGASCTMQTADVEGVIKGCMDAGVTRFGPAAIFGQTSGRDMWRRGAREFESMGSNRHLLLAECNVPSYRMEECYGIGRKTKRNP